MAQQTETVNPFPQDLPARTQTPQRQRGWHNCFTCRFLSSYSLRGISDRRTKWRRIGMCTLLAILFATAVWDIVNFFIFNFTLIGGVLIGVNIVWLWLMAFSIAMIGDTTGVRRMCGINYGRTFFDYLIIVCLVIYVTLFLASVFYLGPFMYEILWGGIGIIIMIFASIASKPAIYPEGVV